MVKPTDDVKKLFFDTLVGQSVTTKGLVVNHDEELTKAGVQQIWDSLKLADLKIVSAS